MLFNSARFFAFFVGVYALYVASNHRWQNRLLVVASWVFYGLWGLKALALLLLTIAVDFNVARFIEAAPTAAKKRRLLVISLVTNLSLLGFFKYYNFFVDNLSASLALVGVDARGLHLELLLPVGISFYTFHTMSYVIDVYRGVLPACHDFVDFALFVSFFPQLVAGPIARAQQLLPQMERPRKIEPDQFVAGLFLIAQGLFKKVVVADGCGRVVNAVFGHDQDFSGLDKLVAVYAFAWEIYGDFSGYSDMARGLAKLMGFELMVNFDLPYFSTNPSEFWRRWHISLSSWLRDYLYIPLGGNRGGPLFNYRNLFLTMLIGGVWHGASWTMVLWGAYQGVCLIAHRLIAGRGGSAPPGAMAAPRRCVQTLLMFQVTCLGWLVFRAQSVGQIGRFVRDIAFDLRPSAFTASYARLALELALPLALYELVLFRAGDLEPFTRWSPRRKAAFALGLAAASGYFVVFHRSLVQGDLPFIYFQF